MHIAQMMLMNVVWACNATARYAVGRMWIQMTERPHVHVRWTWETSPLATTKPVIVLSDLLAYRTQTSDTL
jgi:hypothetical protein